MTRIEYGIFSEGISSMEELVVKLNRAGEAGWKIAHIITFGNFYVQMLLMREVSA